MACQKRIADEDAMAMTDTAPMRRAVAFCDRIAVSEKVVAPYFSDIVQAYQQSYPDDETGAGVYRSTCRRHPERPQTQPGAAMAAG